MINLPKEKCFGCYGCFNICPKEAIKLVEDSYGFKYPTIDPKKCVDCHLCEKICTSLHPLPLSEPLEVVLAVEKNKDEYETVSSGGLCTILCKKIIESGGIVYGCSEKDYMTIRHIRISDSTEIDLLKKSKYVFSEINRVYCQVREDLRNGQTVLFIGTPCQVSGLYGFLQKNYDNLFTVDLVCHGVPSQKMLTQHIDSINKLKKVDKTNGIVDFRWKSRYGVRYGVRFGVNGKILYEEINVADAYMAAFTSELSYRDNCYSCPFAQGCRIGDVTAGDGQICESQKGESENSGKSNINDLMGCSLVMLNTHKGKVLFESVKDEFIIEKQSLEQAQKYNKNLLHPSPVPKNRDIFLRVFAENGISMAAKKCIPIYRKNINPLRKVIKAFPILNSVYRLLKKTH